jgi:peptide deformylase
MSILFYPDKLLTTPCEPVTDFSPEVQELVDTLTKGLAESDGLGLAAPQLGILKQVFVCQIGQIDIMAFVNPRIEEWLGEEITVREGCLSLPGVDARVKRCNRIRIRAFSPLQEEFYVSFIDREAVAFQHELDHLSGITLFERMDRVQRLAKRHSYIKRVSKWTASQKTR